nr:peptidoglycan recognition protein 4 isoform 2 [Littorina littorea]
MKMKFVSVLELLVVLVCCADVVLSDSKCLIKYGKCQYTSSTCSGSYVSGLCYGSTNRRCCVPAFNDGRCTSRRGTCQSTRLACRGGSYVSGLCGGPSDRRCCVSRTGTSTGGSGVGGGISGSCNDVTIVSRAQWGARRPRSTSRMRTPVSLVFIHHTDGRACSDLASCKKVMQGVQNYHMDDPSRRYSDIGYSFLVGGDGKVYEGRGWDRQGAHTKNYNSRAIAISFMGDFMSQSPTSGALRAAKNIIACGVRQGKVSSNYKLYGHRQARGASTTCPGSRLYSIITRWNRYTSGTAP